MVKESKMKDVHMKRIARTVYDQECAQLMATIKLERMFPEGGFFPQAGTNLTASAHKYRKQKHGESQTSPLLQHHHNKNLNLLFSSLELLCLVYKRDDLNRRMDQNEN